MRYITPSPGPRRISRVTKHTKQTKRRKLEFNAADGVTTSMETEALTPTAVGEPEGTCDTKKAIVWAGYTPRNTAAGTAEAAAQNDELPIYPQPNQPYGIQSKGRYNTLYYTENLFKQLEYGTGPNKRRDGCIDAKGIQFDIHAMHNSGRIVAELHYAVISPKESTFASSDPGIKTDFFRHYSSSTARDFNNAGTGAWALSGIEMCNNPINTDKWYVITHKKVMLGSGVGSATTANVEPWVSRQNSGAEGKNCHFARIWVKINRQIKYNNPTETDVDEISPADDMRLVWWFANPFSLGTTKQTTDAMQEAELAKLTLNYYNGNNSSVNTTATDQPQTLFQSRAILYFRDS